jgi:hypothetical protein
MPKQDYLWQTVEMKSKHSQHQTVRWHNTFQTELLKPGLLSDCPMKPSYKLVNRLASQRSGNQLLWHKFFATDFPRPTS